MTYTQKPPEPKTNSGRTEQDDSVQRLTSAMGRQPTRLPTEELPVVHKGPSAAKILLFTMASMLIMLGVASYFIVSLRSGIAVVDMNPEEDADRTGNLAELARLKADRSSLQDELGELRRKLESVESNRSGLDRELMQKQRVVENTSEMLTQRSSAAANLVEATMLLERRADLARALQLTVEALDLDSELVYAHRIRGLVLAASGRREEAISAFVEADEAAREMGAPGDPEAMLQAGELIYTNTNDSESAAPFFRKALVAGEESVTGMLARARMLAFEGRLEEADARAGEAREAARGNALAHLVIGEIALLRATIADGETRAALRREADVSLARAMELDEYSARAALLRGKLLVEEAEALDQRPGFGLIRFGYEKQAERLLSRALQLDPRSPEAHLALARLRVSDGAFRDVANAKIRANEAIRLTDGIDPRAFAMLAAAEAASGEYGRAAESIRQAIKLDPDNPAYKNIFGRYQQDANLSAR